MYYFIDKIGNIKEVSQEVSLKEARKIAEKELGDVDYIGTSLDARKEWGEVFFGVGNE